MTIFLLIAMALLLIAALERKNRRQAPHTRGLYGTYDHDDRDLARIKLDLLAIGDARPGWNAMDRKGPRPA
jgi:hypothetical protein